MKNILKVLVLLGVGSSTLYAAETAEAKRPAQVAPSPDKSILLLVRKIEDVKTDLARLCVPSHTTGRYINGLIERNAGAGSSQEWFAYVNCADEGVDYKLLEPEKPISQLTKRNTAIVLLCRAIRAPEKTPEQMNQINVVEE